MLLVPFETNLVTLSRQILCKIPLNVACYCGYRKFLFAGGEILMNESRRREGMRQHRVECADIRVAKLEGA